MRLIVGLGNPGPEYEWTPHNLGFLAVDALGGRAGIRVTRPEAKSHVGLGTIGGTGSGAGQAADDDESERRGGADLLERYECKAAEMIVLSDEWRCRGACCGFGNEAAPAGTTD